MASDELHYLTLLEAGRKICDGEISSAELTAAMLARIDELNGNLHPYVTVLAETAEAEAAQADAELARGEGRGPMHGVPLAVKDLMAMAGVRTSAGMPMPSVNSCRSMWPGPLGATMVTSTSGGGWI